VAVGQQTDLHRRPSGWHYKKILSI